MDVEETRSSCMDTESVTDFSAENYIEESLNDRDVSFDDLLLSDTQKHLHFQLYENIKKHFNDPTTSKIKKLQILTLLPSNWSSLQIQKEFHASTSAVEASRRILDTKGILEIPEKTSKGYRLSETLTTLVTEFFKRQDVSVEMPGIKDSVVIKKNGQRVHMQKRLVLCNLSELYRYFKEEHENEKIGFSSFCNLRPKECVLAGSTGTHTICVCPIHQNFKLMLLGCDLYNLSKTSATPLTNYRDCLKLVTCENTTEDCSFGKCNSCSNKNFSELIINILESNSIEKVTFKHWVTTTRATLETIIKPVDEYVSDVCHQLKLLLPHAFIAEEQSKFLKEKKNSLQTGEFIIIIDFAENYAFVVQNAVPGFHWNNDQATIYNAVIYYVANNQVNHRSLVIVSDNLSHDATAVYTYNCIIQEYLKAEFESVNKCYYFSDGAPQQYKNYKNVLNLASHKADFDVYAEWHYFPTSHGKGPCDGLGGSVKRAATRASLQMQDKQQILNAKELYSWFCQTDRLPKISFFFSDTKTYNSNCKKLQKRYQNSNRIANLQKKHCLLPDFNSGSIYAKTCSSSADAIMQTILE